MQIYRQKRYRGKPWSSRLLVLLCLCLLQTGGTLPLPTFLAYITNSAFATSGDLMLLSFFQLFTHSLIFACISYFYAKQASKMGDTHCLARYVYLHQL